MGLSRWLERLLKDPERRARAFMLLWWASVAMVCFGYLLIAIHYWGRGSFP